MFSNERQKKRKKKALDLAHSFRERERDEDFCARSHPFFLIHGLFSLLYPSVKREKSTKSKKKKLLQTVQFPFPYTDDVHIE